MSLVSSAPTCQEGNTTFSYHFQAPHGHAHQPFPVHHGSPYVASGDLFTSTHTVTFSPHAQQPYCGHAPKQETPFEQNAALAALTPGSANPSLNPEQLSAPAAHSPQSLQQSDLTSQVATGGSVPSLELEHDSVTGAEVQDAQEGCSWREDSPITMLEDPAETPPFSPQPAPITERKANAAPRRSISRHHKLNRKGKPHFVTKLFYMLEDGSWNSVVRWSLNGDSFIVVSMDTFTKDLLPRHFRHSNFSSFVRQLNKYDFHKMKKNPAMMEKLFGTSPGHSKQDTFDHMWEFKHHYFTTGRPDLLEMIRRKVPLLKKAGSRLDIPEGEELSNQPQDASVTECSSEDMEGLKEQITALKAIQDTLAKYTYTLTHKYTGILADMARVQENMEHQDRIIQQLLQHTNGMPPPFMSPHSTLSLSPLGGEEASPLLPIASQAFIHPTFEHQKLIVPHQKWVQDPSFYANTFA